MGATLDALHRLQEIETQLHVIHQRMEAKRREVKAQTRRMAEVEQNRGDQHDRMKTLQMEIDRLELDRKGREDEIAKYREQMKITKTNKEYAAIRVQINTLDANNRKLEDRILDLMTQMDQLKAEAGGIQAELDRQKERLDKVNEEYAELEAKTGPQVAKLKAQRVEASDRIPATALEAFERVCGYHESEAMAPVIQPHAKREEYICGGCQMSIPLQMVNALLGSDDIQTCTVCGRILFLEGPVTSDKAAAS